MARWIKPSDGFLKVNVSGAFRQEQMTAAVGCVIRDSSGRFQKGCAGMIGIASPVVAAMWALFYGLKLAWEMDNGMGMKRFVIESDSAAAVNFVLHPDPSSPFALLVEMINALLCEAWDALELNIIYEEANIAAKTLAIHNLVGPGGLLLLDSTPSCIEEIIDNEA